MKFWAKRNRRRHAWRTPLQMVLEWLEDRTLLAAPMLDNPIADQSAGVQSLFTFIVPANTFSDTDVGDTLTLSATLSNGDPLPAWLTFTPATTTFSGTAGDSDIGSVEVKVTATDSTLLTAADTFQLTVPPNQVPSFTKGADQTTLEDLGAQFATTFSPGQNVNVSQLLRSQTEVHVAVNPTNPQNIVMVANGGGNDAASEFIANSFDGGNTWTTRNLGVTQDAVVGAFPQRFDGAVAFDRFGNLHVVYMADPDINASQRTAAIVYATSSDGGSTFGARVLAPVAANNDKPWIATGPDAANPAQEAVYVTYQNSSGLLAVRGAKIFGPADVGPFSTAATITSSTTSEFAVPAVGPTGQLTVTWMDTATTAAQQGPSKIMFSRDTNGLANGVLSFETPILITSTQVGPADVIPASPDRTIFASPYLAFDLSNGAHQGRLYCAYADESPAESNDTDIFVRYSDNNGTTWSDRVRVNDDQTTRSQFFQNISVDPVTGHVFLSWYDARNDSGSGGIDTDNKSNTDVQVFVSASIDGGATFSPNVKVSAGRSNQADDSSGFSENDFGDYAGIAAYNDVVHLGWADNSNSTGDNANGTFDVYTDRLGLLTGWATDISAGAAYESGQTVNFVVTTDNDALFSVLPTISSTGVLSYTPAPDANGLATVTVKIEDNGGTANGGVDTSDTQTFKITVTPVNDVPSFSKGTNLEVTVNAGPQVVAGWATGILKGPSNEASQTVDFIVTTDKPELFVVQPTIAPDGMLTFTPSNGFGGTATVTVRIHDNGGTANGGVDTSAAQTFKITTYVPNVTYSAVGNAKLRAGVSNGQLMVMINGVQYSSFQPAFIETLTINGGTNKDEINLTGLSPVLYPKLTKIIINGNAGNDVIIGSDFAEAISGGAGNDSLKGGGGNDSMTGDAGNDTLQGGAGQDTINGSTGNDAISGQEDDDSLLGGDGNDTILGGVGGDKLLGGNGKDLLIGGFGTDTLDGESGRDTVCGGQGGPQRGGTGGSDAGDVFINNEVISEAFKKLFAWE